MYKWSQVEAGTYALMALNGSAAEVVSSTTLTPEVSTLEEVYKQLKQFFPDSLETPSKLLDLGKLKIKEEEDLSLFALRVQRTLNSFPEINTPARVLEVFTNGLKEYYDRATLDQARITSPNVSEAIDKIRTLGLRDKTTRGKRQFDHTS